MATGYDDIDNLMNQQEQNLIHQEKVQNEIIDKGLQKVQNEVNKQKQNYDEEATKVAKGLYTDYQKASNPYGANTESLVSNGLANSGYAESTRVNLYNSYQKNVTTLVTETNKLKAEADFQMNQAYLEADIQKAQNALTIYQQKAELALQEYQYKFQRDQYEYQKQRDIIADNQWQQNYDFNKQRAEVSDNQWQQQYDYNKQRDEVEDSHWQQQYEYQKQRDAVSDSQWERQYQLSLQSLR